MKSGKGNGEGHGIAVPKRTYVEVIRKGGRRRGYITTHVNDDGKLEVGYSLCELRDRFDGNTGLNIALKRGVRWLEKEGVVVLRQHKEWKRYGEGELVCIPHTIVNRMLDAVEHTTSKFDHAAMPIWVSKLQYGVHHDAFDQPQTLGRKEEK